MPGTIWICHIYVIFSLKKLSDFATKHFPHVQSNTWLMLLPIFCNCRWPCGSEADSSSELSSPTPLMLFSHERYTDMFKADSLPNTCLKPSSVLSTCCNLQTDPSLLIEKMTSTDPLTELSAFIVSKGPGNRESGPLWNFSNLLTFPKCTLFFPPDAFTF